MKSKLVVVLHFFVGIGAMAGGLAALANPASPMGIPTDVLKYGPFRDFLIPGIFLFVFLGIFNIVCGILGLKYKTVAPILSAGMGGILCLWIVVQCIVMMDIEALHIIFFVIGALQVYLGAKEGVILVKSSLNL